MEEQFLQFVWKYQHFNHSHLRLTSGQSLIIFNPGNHNYDSGPDFEEARIKIDSIEWAGHVEIHIRSSDWEKHNHHLDKAYENVILHVVWEDDKEIFSRNEPIPTLELKKLIDDSLLKKYRLHTSSQSIIPCHNQISNKNELSYSAMLDRVMVERLEKKATAILEQLQKSFNDWDEVCYQLLMNSFGFKTNKEAFSKLSEKIPHSVLKKYINDPIKMESLLFGQAGFLSEIKDDYQNQLSKEFQYLSKKHDLKDPLKRHEWKFGKIRPSNFPTLRIAQVAEVLRQQPRLTSSIISVKELNEIFSLFKVDLPSYWMSHYDFGKAINKTQTSIGRFSIDILTINVAVPILAAYSKFSDQQNYMEMAIQFLEQLVPENNRHTREWIKIGKKPKSAFDSQAQIHLLSEYCKKRKCLQCAIGVSILSA